MLWILEQFSFPSGVLDNMRSHSMKVTMLTACGKWPLPLEDRQLLGYHVLKKDSSVLNHNRDNLAGPIQGFVHVLRAMRAGTFMPDAPRDKRHVEKEQAIVVVKQLEQTVSLSSNDIVAICKQRSASEAQSGEAVAGPAVVNDTSPLQPGQALIAYEPEAASPTTDNAADTDSESDDEISLASESDGDSPAPGGNVNPPSDSEEIEALADEVSGDLDRRKEKGRVKDVPADANVQEFFRHVKRRTVHYGNIRDSALLGCCKPELTHHVQVEDGENLHPKCKDCFGL